MKYSVQHYKPEAHSRFKEGFATSLYEDVKPNGWEGDEPWRWNLPFGLITQHVDGMLWLTASYDIGVVRIDWESLEIRQGGKSLFPLMKHR